MQRFGKTLWDYASQRDELFSFKTQLQIGIQVITLIECFHSIGFVHNNICLDNICVGEPFFLDNLGLLKLIDFAKATPFNTPGTNIHVEREEQSFKAKFVFCSPNLLLEKTTSRRDDLISVLYILVYLATGKMPFSEGDEK
jgi:serine/threonine protein kinase